MKIKTKESTVDMNQKKIEFSRKEKECGCQDKDLSFNFYLKVLNTLVTEMSSFVRQFYYYQKLNRKNIHVSL